MDEAPDERIGRLLGLLGLARNAGRLAMGYNAALDLVNRGGRPVVVVATDAGPGQRGRIARWEPVRLLVADAVTGADLARALGREKLSVVATNDPGFAKGIEQLGF
ncbi:MAG: ribosomal L7Ae/L30e/S12e/Gadd45 family protein [Candidatus Krumholzibacteriia bacterium]